MTMLGMLGVVYIFMIGVVSPFLLRTATPPDISNVRTLAAALSFTLLGTGLNQEVHFRDFLQSRFATVFGGDRAAWHQAVALTSVVFGLLHLGLGPANAVVAGLAGLLLGEMYLWTNRESMGGRRRPFLWQRNSDPLLVFPLNELLCAILRSRNPEGAEIPFRLAA